MPKKRLIKAIKKRAGKTVVEYLSGTVVTFNGSARPRVRRRSARKARR